MKIDTVVDLELFSRFTSILSFLSGAKRVAGFYKYNMEGLYRGKLQTHRIEYNPHYHISQSFMTLVYELDSDLREVPLGKFEVKKEEVISAKISSKKVPKEKILKKLLLEDSLLKKDSKIILINPNASELLPIRKWPIENFISVIKKILALESTYVVLTGVQSDKCDAQKIIRTINDNRCIDFTGKTSFKELIDLYNISTLIISNDSGPAHFASLTDINIIVLFGPETPKLYSPLSKNCICLYANYACSPCVSAFNHRKTSCTSSKCLEEITPDAVFAISKDIIENK
jgi:ADP-heptose:LPS heptosyltransferase